MDQDEDLHEEQLQVEGSEIDVSDIIRESLLISLPMKVVCSETCPGLCPSCGADLAEGDCGCAQEGIALRLAPLSTLLELWPQAARPERRKDEGSTEKETFKVKNK